MGYTDLLREQFKVWILTVVVTTLLDTFGGVKNLVLDWLWNRWAARTSTLSPCYLGDWYLRTKNSKYSWGSGCDKELVIVMSVLCLQGQSVLRVWYSKENEVITLVG